MLKISYFCNMNLKITIMRRISLFLLLLTCLSARAQHGQILSDHTFSDGRIIITTSVDVSYTKFFGDSTSLHSISMVGSFNGKNDEICLRVPILYVKNISIPEGTKLLILFEDDSVVTLTSNNSIKRYNTSDLKLYPFDQSLVEKVRTKKVIALRMETGYYKGYIDWYDGMEKHWIFNEVFLSQYDAIMDRLKNGIALEADFNKKHFENVKTANKNKKTLKRDPIDDMY